ncbi:MAG: pilus assembly protein PilX [Gammaproteobacteria bacterium]|nr:MAG: pilus assembly protein PilX [Gammaproteobacteria bacterium]TLY88530.1 MAG: pilus assembly protein PilX [Gammaproteobacteria bacterium]
MSAHTSSLAPVQRGVALISSLLLLVIITILALSMFRSFGTQEKIAGNLREKDRALHAATSAQQYGEWWLTQGSNAAIGAVACAGTLNANLGQGQICNQTPSQAGYTVTRPETWAAQIQYVPPTMGVSGVAGPNSDPPYFGPPAFYVTDLGVAGDGAGEAYQIDAYGYGSTAGTVAVVESTYEVAQGVVNRGGL